MRSIAESSVTIQTSAQSVPSPPCWLGEVTLIAHSLTRKAGACSKSSASALGSPPFRTR
jgi:hypothetical protein